MKDEFKSQHAALLNKLSDMVQASYYALAAHTLITAEMLILQQEREIEKLKTELAALAAQAPQVPQEYTAGHCVEKANPKGCQLHNLQCGYPDCDRKPVTALREAPAGQEAVKNVKPCGLGCIIRCRARLNGCASECPSPAYAQTLTASQPPAVQGVPADLLKALDDLSFDCFDGIGTCAPSVEVYNRTFNVLEKYRALAKAAAPQPGEQNA